MGLPNGYTRLEYIESTGTQYVDTRYVPTSENLKVDTLFSLTSVQSWKSLFGSENGANGPWSLIAIVNNAATMVFYTGTSAGVGGVTVSAGTLYDLTCQVNNGKLDFSCNDVSGSVNVTGTVNKAQSLYIFTQNSSVPSYTTSQMSSMRLCACQIYDNGVLVRDFIPVQRLDGTVGLLDQLNFVFYPDAAGGNFVAGPVVLPPDPPGPYNPPDYIARTQAYMAALRNPLQKLCRLRFLQPDGSTAFSLDNNPKNKKSGAFVSDGSISVNLQNGKRRSATVTLSNLDNAFDYNVNTVWFGTEIAVDEGLVLPNGSEHYIQQGVFLIENPVESVRPANRMVTYNLVDKWAKLDGTLFGNLESTYEIPVGTNIFQPMKAILDLDKGNGEPLDRVTPVFTEYYNGKSQALPDGTSSALINAPYTLRVDSDGGTYADIFLGLAGMVNAWIGYDQTGALRIDPSQDDILDSNKPVLWQFSMDGVTFLGADYTVKNTEVYNDYIVLGELLDDNSQPAGRATNMDPRSDTNVQTIGRKTFRMSAPGYATDQQCQDLAVWKLKRSSGLQKAISISCSQIFHIEENGLVTIVRTDKPGSPVERHLVMGFTRPLSTTGEMQINAVSVQDFVTATITSWPE